jgi:hypothetical protein
MSGPACSFLVRASLPTPGVINFGLATISPGDARPCAQWVYGEEKEFIKEPALRSPGRSARATAAAANTRA